MHGTELLQMSWSTKQERSRSLKKWLWPPLLCTRARFTVLVSCSGEFEVHSWPLLCPQGQLWWPNLWTDCFTVGLYCV